MKHNIRAYYSVTFVTQKGGKRVCFQGILLLALKEEI